MRFRKPSPSMVVSIVALVMATTGSAVAAVDFARNAGAVDGLSAVAASSSLNRAAGRLVATARGGSHKGRIPSKFLANTPVEFTFSKAFDVPDNASGAPVPLNSSGFGTLSAQCNDQNNTAGVEDPTTTITFANTSALNLNLARTIGGANPAVAVEQLPAGTQHQFNINGSNTFRLHLEQGGVDLVVEGQVRQDGRGTANASCVVVGYTETFTP